MKKDAGIERQRVTPKPRRITDSCDVTHTLFIARLISKVPDRRGIRLILPANSQQQVASGMSSLSCTKICFHPMQLEHLLKAQPVDSSLELFQEHWKVVESN